LKIAGILYTSTEKERIWNPSPTCIYRWRISEYGKVLFCLLCCLDYIYCKTYALEKRIMREEIEVLFTILGVDSLNEFVFCFKYVSPQEHLFDIKTTYYLRFSKN